METHNSLGQSGRTHRMLEAAIAAAAEGHRSIVVCLYSHLRWMHERIVKLGGDCMGRQRRADAWEYSCEAWGGGCVLLRTPDGAGGIDWARLRYTGQDENDPIFIDHATIELRCAVLLAELHRYDPQPPDLVEQMKKAEANHYFGRTRPAL